MTDVDNYPKRCDCGTHVNKAIHDHLISTTLYEAKRYATTGLRNEAALEEQALE